MKNTPPPPSSAAPAKSPLVSPEEVAAVIQAMDPVPPVILNLEEAAAISRYTVGSLRKLAGDGRFPLSTIKGRPLRFWRDRFVWEIVNAQACRPRKLRKAKPYRAEAALPKDAAKASKATAADNIPFKSGGAK